MNLDEMIKLNNEIITEEELNKIIECEDCINFENNGYSGIYPNKLWYSVRLKCDIGDYEEYEVNYYI